MMYQYYDESTIEKSPMEHIKTGSDSQDRLNKY